MAPPGRLMPRRRHRSRPWRSLVPAAAMVVLSACGQSDSGTEHGTDHHGGSGGAGLAHIHGLGIDPADGMLYAASHHGVFRVPDGGEPERVSAVQDTMGFTVVGRTWQALSLSGDVDFHALEAKHDKVYGYDSQSGQLMVSADRRTWDRRAQLPMADFAVHPTNPDELLATTQQGLARSTDGGHTFTPVAGAPTLALVDWPTDDTLIAVAPDGTVHHSADGGATWTRRGAVPGAPQALATHDTSQVYVATETGIHASQDGGATFTLRQSLD